MKKKYLREQNRTLLIIFCPNSETLCKYKKKVALFLVQVTKFKKYKNWNPKVRLYLYCFEL